MLIAVPWISLRVLHVWGTAQSMCRDAG